MSHHKSLMDISDEINQVSRLRPALGGIKNDTLNRRRKESPSCLSEKENTLKNATFKTDSDDMEVDMTFLFKKKRYADKHISKNANDIDARDVDEPLAATEYVEDLYIFYKKIEIDMRVTERSISFQPEINEKMFSILIDWIVEVHLRFKLIPDTLYLCVYLILRFSQREIILKSEFQLVGVAALMIASKHEEIYPPEPSDFIYVCDRKYSKVQLLNMELKIIGALRFFIFAPSPYLFLLRYLKAAHADRNIVQMSCFISETLLLRADMLSKHLPSMLACCAIYLSRREFGRNPWSATLLKYSTYEEAELLSCLKDICRVMFQETGRGAVHEKFSARQFGRIATRNMKWDA